MLLNDPGEYLLHLRDNIPGICHPGTWSFIGGGREGDETLEETIARELHEEAGLTIPGLKRFMVISSTGPDGRTKTRVQVFIGRWNGDPDALPITEGIMFRFFPPEIIDRLVTCPGTAEVIRAHRIGRAGVTTTLGARSTQRELPVGIHKTG
ncbi:NUDIX hydrolase [Streptomyces sp. ME19-01-6]|uniref:NUDIX hydrolase n=1 Tax=Streptomyces sp. ME19-01-6 TaxID=3028686 RepID=UPI0029B58507|nr:NUDIX domain-containing protein [Streptomyces sp. ME19-01-6]MDX3224882.1 NUDIX domain-containing protein [Streptomyces sp. ME19-01-6]